VVEECFTERKDAPGITCGLDARSARPRDPRIATQLTKFGRASRLTHPAPQRRGSGRRRTRRHIPFPCRPGTAPLARFTAPAPAPRCRTAKEAGPFLPCFPMLSRVAPPETREQQAGPRAGPALVACRSETTTALRSPSRPASSYRTRQVPAEQALAAAASRSISTAAPRTSPAP